MLILILGKDIDWLLCFNEVLKLFYPGSISGQGDSLVFNSKECNIVLRGQQSYNLDFEGMFEVSIFNFLSYGCFITV